MSSADPAPAGKIRLKYRVEYRLLATTTFFVAHVPYRVGLAFAAFVARFLFHVARFRRRETLRRIRSVFPGISPRAARRIAYLSLRNLAFNVVEMLRIRTFDSEKLHCLFPNLDDVVARIRALQFRSAQTAGSESPQGVILALPHMGNWDLAGSACFLDGIQIFSVAGKQRNPLVNNLLNRLRSGHGMDIVERGSRTLMQIIARLRAGNVFAILPDTRNRLPDLDIPFLGGRANLARGMATFAKSTNSPIFPIYLLRKGWTRFEIVPSDPVYPDPALDKDADVRRMTELVIARVDAAIHAHPEQWFWYNKRWVLDPVNPPSS